MFRVRSPFTAALLSLLVFAATSCRETGAWHRAPVPVGAIEAPYSVMVDHMRLQLAASAAAKPAKTAADSAMAVRTGRPWRPESLTVTVLMRSLDGSTPFAMRAESLWVVSGKHAWVAIPTAFKDIYGAAVETARARVTSVAPRAVWHDVTVIFKFRDSHGQPHVVAERHLELRGG